MTSPDRPVHQTFCNQTARGDRGAGPALRFGLRVGFRFVEAPGTRMTWERHELLR